MPVRLFFAGAEGNSPFRTLNKLKVRQRLMSFYYLRLKSPKRQDELFYGTDPEDAYFLIDSGAFTIMDTLAKKALLDPKWWWDYMEKYLEDYLAFLEKYKKSGKILAAAELDVDDLLVKDRMFYNSPEKWRKPLDEWWDSRTHNNNLHTGEFGFTPPPIKQWRDQIQATGVPLLASWHRWTRQWPGWLDECKEFKYLGIGSSDTDLDHQFPLFNEARRCGTYVHGFAYTKEIYLRKYPMYSADSSTWMSGSRYGVTVVFQNGRLRHYDGTQKKRIRPKFRLMWEQYGLTWDRIEADDFEAIDEVNVLAWLQFAEYLKKSPNKDYWTCEVNGAPLDSFGPIRAGGLDVDVSLLPTPDEVDSIPEAELDEIELGKSMIAVPEETEQQPTENLPVKMGPIAPDIIPRTEKLVQITEKSTGNNPLRTLEFLPFEDVMGGMLKCDNCYIRDRCPYNETGAQCYFKPAEKANNSRDALGTALDELIYIQRMRVAQTRFQEQMDGGIIDKNLSGEMDRLVSMINARFSLMQRANTTEEITIQAKGGPGVIEKMLAGVFEKKPRAKKKAPSPKEEEATIIDVG